MYILQNGFCNSFKQRDLKLEAQLQTSASRVVYSRLMSKVVDWVDDPGFESYLDDEILHTPRPRPHLDLLRKVLGAHRKCTKAVLPTQKMKLGP